MGFDPSVTASHKVGIFGLPTTADKSLLHILPVPWDVTTSYGGGASLGPQAILEASPQIDLFDLEAGKSHEKGYHLLSEPKGLKEQNEKLRQSALKIRGELEETGELSEASLKAQEAINKACKEMVESVHDIATVTLKGGKIFALIGGDHSTPQGAIQAISENLKGDFGVLHIDAHADLRKAYQGFAYSHASIMYNVMTAKWRPKCLVQVGIRDFSEEEFSMIQDRADITTFFDQQLKSELLSGSAWSLICRKIIEKLPENVYISFDIDGLSPEFCPHTGTPVPGGLSYDQVLYLFSSLVKAGRRIVGFDLNEVAPGSDEWDGNVGARLLYKLCGLTVLANQTGVGQ